MISIPAFFFTGTPPTEIYTLSLHDALPIFEELKLEVIALCQVVRNLGSKEERGPQDRKSTRLNSSHTVISYAVFCLKKKRPEPENIRVHFAAWRAVLQAMVNRPPNPRQIDD